MLRNSLYNKIFDVINIIMLIIISFVIIYPLYFTVIASISNPYPVMRGEVLLWPKEFTLEPYTNIFINDDIWIGYYNTILNTVLVTIYNLAITIPCAYAMARRELRGKNIIMFYFVFTMYFSGGMIPSYLLVKQLNLINSRWALVIPSGMSVFNMIITRTFFQTNLSEELFEAAKIDGCSEFGIFFKIAVPLSGAIIAVIALYVAVGSWNAYFGALLYINDKKLYPLQYVLRNILISNQQMKFINTSSLDARQLEAIYRKKMMAESMKYSLIFVSSLPMLVAYPFVQKYFVKGVMIGALKG